MTLYEAMEQDKKRRMALAPSAPRQTVVHQTVITIDATKARNIAFTIKKAESDISHLECEIEDLNALFDLETDNACFYRNAGNKVKEAQAMRKIISLRKSIHTAENALAKAKLTRIQAQEKLYA